MTRHRVELTVNRTRHEVLVEPRKTLADLLREDLALTGTHLGCEHGVCGACTVIVNGDAVRSCLMLAVQARGAEIVTIEGLAEGDSLHPVQQAFWDSHSFQCGFCTPGFIMTTVALLARRQDLTEEAVRAELSANICRCTGYQTIVAGALLAAARAKEGASAGAEGSSGH